MFTLNVSLAIITDVLPKFGLTYIATTAGYTGAVTLLSHKHYGLTFQQLFELSVGRGEGYHDDLENDNWWGGQEKEDISKFLYLSYLLISAVLFFNLLIGIMVCCFCQFYKNREINFCE